MRRSVAHANLFFDSETRRRLLLPVRTDNGSPKSAPEDYKAGLCKPNGTALRQATTADFKSYLVDDILVKVDRASMLTSLEVRAPWLDPRIIEFAFGRVPDSLRAVVGQRKILPRMLASRLLPPALDLKRKQGFALPMDRWFKGDWGRYIERTLSEIDGSPFDPTTVRMLIVGQHRGYANAHRLFALGMFELWRRHYRVLV
jgi:asparagine synthase (glutamine-hydrolysing)